MYGMWLAAFISRQSGQASDYLILVAARSLPTDQPGFSC